MPHHIVHLVIDSEQRTTGINESFSMTMTPPIRYVEKVILKGFSIPASFYNINSTNNQLVYTDDGGQFTITITPANYTGESLADAIKLAMLVNGAGHIVQFDLDTFKFTFTYTGVGNLTLSDTTDEPTSTLFPLLGFSITQSGAKTYTSDEVANIASPRHINIKSTLITTSKLGPNLQNGTVDEIIHVLYPNVDFGCMMIKQGVIQEYDYIRAFDITSIDLRLEDENDNLLDLNGVGWCINFDFVIE